MKKTVFAIIGCALILVYFYSSRTTPRETKLKSDSIGYTVTPGKMQHFYHLYGEALHKLKDNGDFNGALPLLKDALQYAETQPEAAMIHYELAKIYHSKNDHDKELAAQLAVVKYTMNNDIRKKSTARVNELLTNRKPDAVPQGSAN